MVTHFCTSAHESGNEDHEFSCNHLCLSSFFPNPGGSLQFAGKAHMCIALVDPLLTWGLSSVDSAGKEQGATASPGRERRKLASQEFG